MQIERLAAILTERVANAPKGDRVTRIHLFRIEFAEEIGDAATRVVQASDVDDSYATEVRKGMKLAKHVRLI